MLSFFCRIMRESSIDTRIVTYVEPRASFRKVFDTLIEQLVNSGLYDIRYFAGYGNFRLWITKPRERQIIFISQSEWDKVRGITSPIISISQVEKFLKNGG